MSDEMNQNQEKQEVVNNPQKSPKKKKSKNKGLLVFIIIIVLVLAFGIFKDFFAENSSLNPVAKKGKNYIAELYIEGTIQEENESYNQAWLLETIDTLKNDVSNVGIMLFINSPGGAVYESDQVYLALLDYSQNKPVWAYLGATAASGGYYIACSAEKIIANRNTLTGSIGVIAGQSIDLSEFMAKHGIKMNTITAGKNKNMLNIDQPLTPEQRAIMQSVADECYNQFTQIVSTSRNLSKEKVTQLADGRIYTAQQALKHKLIDEILTYEEAKTQMKIYFTDIKDLTFTEFRYTKEKSFYNYLFDIYSNVQGLTSQSSFLEKIMAESSQIEYPAYLYVK